MSAFSTIQNRPLLQPCQMAILDVLVDNHRFVQDWKRNGSNLPIGEAQGGQ